LESVLISLKKENAMYPEKDDCAKNAEREPASHEIMYSAARIAEKAEALEKRMHGKLGPVMMLCPPPCEAVKGKSIASYPPLFEDLRSKLDVIERALNSMEDALSRTEL
jgi:hypothetical protein